MQRLPSRIPTAMAIAMAGLLATASACDDQDAGRDASVLSPDGARGPGPTTDGAPVDAMQIDAALIDAGVTSCGSELSCNADTEICVITIVNIAKQYACEPVPGGCDSDRSCDCVQATFCEAPWDTCTSPDVNVIQCECLECG